MRTLTASEVDQVSGGALNLGTGFLAAGVTGLGHGAGYSINAYQTGSFSWAGFTFHAANGAASGFLIGTGATLIYAGATGAIKGVTVAGVTSAGAGTALGVAGAVSGSGSSSNGEGGGSD